MEYRPLGKTGLMVSSLSLGTVSLGVDYGIQAPGNFGRPDEREGIRLLREAADAGINFFDTAPAYGDAERIVGAALGKRKDCLIATKVNIPRDADNRSLHGVALRLRIGTSLEKSLLNLQRDSVDVLQIHNATADMFTDSDLPQVLELMQAEGRFRHAGVSVYTEDEALAAIRSGVIAFVQIPYNVLDQRIAKQVLPEAKAAGVAIAARSAFLKGVLSAKAQWLPAGMESLKNAAQKARDMFGGSWDRLPEYALRFCLSEPRLTSVLVGPRTVDELEHGLDAWRAGPLPQEYLIHAPALAIEDPRWLNPANWPAVA